MTMNKPSSPAAGSALQPAAGGGAVSPVGRVCARGLGRRRRAAWLVVLLAGTMLLAACGGSPAPAASPGQSLYARELAYSQCMRSHGVPDFPILKQAPGGKVVHPVSPPPGMLTAPGYDAAFRACLKLAVTSAGDAAHYRAAALKGLQQAECMRAHGVTGYPSPGALDGGLHVPDYTVIGFDPHTLRFQAAGRACGTGPLWQVLWWWPAGMTGPVPGMDGEVRSQAGQAGKP